MRGSIGRTASSKRPDSSCWSSVTSAWKRRPRLSTSTMSPGAMPFEVAREARSRSAGGSAGVGGGREAVVGGDVLLEGVPRVAHREEVEAPPAVVVQQHDGELERQSPRREQAADVV